MGHILLDYILINQFVQNLQFKNIIFLYFLQFFTLQVFSVYFLRIYGYVFHISTFLPNNFSKCSLLQPTASFELFFFVIFLVISSVICFYFYFKLCFTSFLFTNLSFPQSCTFICFVFNFFYLFFFVVGSFPFFWHVCICHTLLVFICNHDCLVLLSDCPHNFQRPRSSLISFWYFSRIFQHQSSQLLDF